MLPDQDITRQQIDDALTRIDRVLNTNRQTVWHVVSMASVIFVLGVSLFVVGIKTGDWKILTPSAVITGLLYWPIDKILRIRKENIELAVVPALVRTLPPEKAAEEIVKLIEKLRP